jgi:hypothetical protein
MSKNAITETFNIDRSDAISELSELFRRAVNLIVDSTSNGRFLAEFSKKLPMVGSSTDWHRLCAAMDILEDTETAKANFIRFGLQGQTRHQDIGETYLRLYGILNGIYLQRQALVTIAKYSNNGDLASLKSKLDKSEVVTLRHKVASHNLECVEDGTVKAYMTSRFELAGTSVSTMDETDKYITYDLQECIRSFDSIVIEEILQATARLLAKIHAPDPDKQDMKVLLKHYRNLLDGKKYISTEGKRVYVVGMSEPS